jgi:hypothetical protein
VNIAALLVNLRPDCGPEYSLSNRLIHANQVSETFPYQMD